jgi:hypothetical protein
MRWEEVHEAPTGMIKQKRQRFLQPEAGWCELQEQPSCDGTDKVLVDAIRVEDSHSET